MSNLENIKQRFQIIGNSPLKIFNKLNATNPALVSPGDTVSFYEIDKKSLNFSSIDKKSFDGYFDFKPFYLKASFNYDGISTKDILIPVLLSSTL